MKQQYRVLAGMRLRTGGRKDSWLAMLGALLMIGAIAACGQSENGPGAQQKAGSVQAESQRESPQMPAGKEKRLAPEDLEHQ
jgi:hypothetical protein